MKGKKPYSKGSCRKVRGNPARQADEAIARELLLFIENDEILSTRRYPQFILNLERKMKRGVYDRERAVKLFMYLADEASKRYSKQFGDGKTHTADVPTRMLLAKMLRDRFESERRAMGIPETEMADLEEPMGMIRGKRVLRRNPSCGVTMNPVRTKTWKLGEYGGNIKANVNESGTAVQIIHSDKPLIAGAYGRLFRWPLDRNELDMHLTDLTTSYYASKIIEWVESVTKGTNMNPVKTRGVDVFVFMKDKFAYSEEEDDIDKISRKNKGRDIGGGTDMRTGLREKQYYFRSNGDATRFIKMVKKLGVMKGYRASYADSAREWPYKSKPIRLNPREIDPNLAYKKEYGWTFVDFLKKRLIPDLRESGMDATADDYQRGISLYRDKKGVLPITSFMNYLKYLRETLIPDLKASGSESTAADFERMYKMVLYTINHQPKSRGL